MLSRHEPAEERDKLSARNKYRNLGVDRGDKEEMEKNTEREWDQPVSQAVTEMD